MSFYFSKVLSMSGRGRTMSAMRDTRRSASSRGDRMAELLESPCRAKVFMSAGTLRFAWREGKVLGCPVGS